MVDGLGAKYNKIGAVVEPAVKNPALPRRVAQLRDLHKGELIGTSAIDSARSVLLYIDRVSTQLVKKGSRSRLTAQPIAARLDLTQSLPVSSGSGVQPRVLSAVLTVSGCADGSEVFTVWQRDWNSDTWAHTRYTKDGAQHFPGPFSFGDLAKDAGKHAGSA